MKTLPKYIVLAVILGGAGLLLWQAFGPNDTVATARLTVAEADLSPTARNGKQAFDAVCAECHGANAAGTDQGPPLVHDIYNPGHHPDAAFFAAARFGVRQHHWPYGNMPPQPDVTEAQVAAIVQYVRELQVANGIVSRPHTM